MNESLQTKLDELRAKNAKFVVKKAAARTSGLSLGGGGSLLGSGGSGSSPRGGGDHLSLLHMPSSLGSGGSSKHRLIMLVKRHMITSIQQWH
eukprot:15364758-Ditylum_brightwellii.AAC.1